jgi:hypothetical protein
MDRPGGAVVQPVRSRRAQERAKVDPMKAEIRYCVA